MATLSKVWSDSLNNEFSDQEDQAVQYREACYALKQAFTSALWTVTLSTDGTNAPTATDQWSSAAILLYGNAAQTRAWCVLRSPDNWVVGAGLYNYILIGLDNVNTDLTPQTITWRGSCQPFTGGSTTTYPTSATGVWTMTSTSILAYTAPARATWNAWWTSDGDVYFGIKGVGVSCFSTFLLARSSGTLAATDGGLGIYRGVYAFCDSTTILTDVVTWTEFGLGGNFRSFLQNGEPPVSNTTNFLSSLSYFSSWPGGAVDGGRVPDGPIDIGTNSATRGEPRYFGQLIDVRAAPTLAPFNNLIDGDTDAIRLVCIGDLWMPSTARLI